MIHFYIYKTGKKLKNSNLGRDLHFWLFQDIFQKKIGGQKNVGNYPHLNFSIFFLFYIYKNGSFKHYFFLRFQISKKLTRPSVPA